MKSVSHIENLLSDEESAVSDSPQAAISSYLFMFAFITALVRFFYLQYEIDFTAHLIILTLIYGLVYPISANIYVRHRKKEIFRHNHSKDLLDKSEIAQYDYRAFCYSQLKFRNSPFYEYNRGFVYIGPNRLVYKTGTFPVIGSLEPIDIKFVSIQEVSIKACRPRVIDYVLNGSYASRLIVTWKGTNYIFRVADAHVLKDRLLEYFDA